MSMVDQVGPKPATAFQPRVAPVAKVAGAQTVQQTVQDGVERAAPSTLRALSQPLANTPPVDVERVAKIKKAIADGNFPLVPSTIADRLLALKLQWHPHEQA
jgi:negative regulator of flagellin synthesis FlgM